MTCYHPLRAWRSKNGRSKNGKWPITFKISEAYSDMPIVVPCGQCIGCRLERSRQWAIRCMHESQLYENNCFVTLTYNNDNLPVNGTLVKRHLTLFIKRLRKQYGNGIRYYACGEYGELYNRPHYHVCFFNHDFHDKEFLMNNNGNKLYRSDCLDKLWPYGYASIGAVTFESAGYVARYIMKKQLGKDSEMYYKTKGIIPEYTVMSRRPGIGTGWFEKYSSDVYPLDEVIVRNKKMKPPRFYDKLYDLTNPSELAKIKSKRKFFSRNSELNDPYRRYAKEQVKLQKIKRLVRPVEGVGSI